MSGTYRKIFCNKTQLTPGIRLHYLLVVHLLPQTQLSNPAAQDGFLSVWLLRQCLAPAWVCPTGSLCVAGEHTCMGHLIHLKRSESYGISLSTPLHTRCTYIMALPKVCYNSSVHCYITSSTCDSSRLQIERYPVQILVTSLAILNVAFHSFPQPVVGRKGYLTRS